MNKTFEKQPIPWEHKSSAVVSSWTWTTTHFTVSIFAEGLSSRKMYNWKILDKSTGFPRPFDNGMAMSFNEAVEALLEVIGKGYARELGYLAYAGKFATTFQISDGKKYDFAGVIGESVVARVIDAEGSETVVTGLFDIHHYDFIISNGDNAMTVPPLKVIDILREFGMTSLIKTTSEEPTRSRTGRIVHEEWRKGCTGKPGFRPGTTQHPPNAPYCSIHRI
jgi:hypothetical protein